MTRTDKMKDIYTALKDACIIHAYYTLKPLLHNRPTFINTFYNMPKIFENVLQKFKANKGCTLKIYICSFKILEIPSFFNS